MNLGALTASLGLDLTDFQKSVAMAEDRMRTMGKKMEGVGKKMSLYVTAPLMAVGVAAFKMGKDFEWNMTQIVGMVGVAKNTVEGWKTEVMSMAAETGKSAEELSRALYFITSSGVDSADAMEVLGISAKAAAAGLGETEAVANLVTSALNAYKTSGLTAAQATDILVGATKAGKAEASELAPAMSTVLPLASAMGVSFDQAAAAMAAMTLTGASASETATGLRSILANIQKPSKEAEKALQMMGTSSAELRQTIREDGLLKALQDISGLTKEYGETAVSAVIPNIRALSAMLDLMGQNAEGNAKIFEDLKNSTGLLDIAYQEASGTMEHTWNKAMASSKNALIAIGETMKESVVPILEIVAEKVQQLANWFTKLSPEMKQVITGLAAFVAAAGPALVFIGKMSSGIPIVTKAISVLKVAFSSLAKLLLTNPWGIAIAAIAAVGYAVYKLVTMNERFATSSELIGNATKKAKENIAGESAELEVMKRKLIAAYGKKEEFNKIVNEWNTKYGAKYNASLNATEANLNDIIVATSKARQEMAKMAYMNVLQDELQNLIKDNTKAYESYLNATEKINREQGVYNNYIQMAKEEYEKYNKMLKDGIPATSKQAKEQKELAEALNGVAIQAKANIAQVQADLQKFDQISGFKTALDTYTNQIVTLQGEMAETGTSTGGAADATNDYANAVNNAGMSMDELMETEESAKKKAEELANMREKMKEQYQGMADDLQELTNARLSINASESEQLRIEWDQRLNDLAKQRDAELALYDKDSAEYASISGKWMLLMEGYLAEYTATQIEYDKKAKDEKIKTLNEEVVAVKEGLLTEEQALRASYEKQVNTIRNAMLSGIMSTEEGTKIIADLYKKMGVEIAKTSEPTAWQQRWTDAANSVIQAVSSAAESMLVSMSEMIGAGALTAENFGKMVLGTLADLAITVGKIAIATGLSIEAIKDSLLSMNPIVAVAAGAALIALGSWAKGALANAAGGSSDSGGETLGAGLSLPGMATGGEVVRSGMFKVGEDGEEVVHLPVGAKVTPNHMLGGFGDMQLVGVIQGSDLKIILDRTEAKNKRR